MIIKKVGHLLLIRLRLFSVLAKLAPLGIIASFFLIFFFFHLKESFKFQQPSLRTRLEDAKTHRPQLILSYKPIRQGIRFIKIDGAIENECLLLTFPQKMQNCTEIKNIFETLTKEIYNSKNVILLSYQSIKQLNEFFVWYYNPQLNKDFSFGIIRAGLNVEFNPQNATYIQTKAQNETKDKAYYHTYKPGLHPDLDYFFSLKDLMQLTLISWLPCEQVHRIPAYRSIKKWFLKLEKSITNQHDVKSFIEHAICQLHNHLFYQLSPHQVMMNQGFQAGTIRFFVGTNRQKPEQQLGVVLSFIKEFSLQEDHLHSARIFFYPMSKTQQLPLNATLFPGLLFLASVAILLINRLVTKFSGIFVSLQYETCIIVYFWLWEYYLKRDNSNTLVLSIMILLECCLKDLINSQNGNSINGKYKKNLVQLIIEPFSALIALYHGLFSYPLSLISMFTTTIILFIPKSPNLKFIYRLAVLSGLLLLLTNGAMTYDSVIPSINHLSYQLKVIIIVMLLRIAM